ncbi:MAG: metallophosphoesterase family protein [Nocardioidaceae bacterium]
MAYTADWVGPAYSHRWPTPPADVLANIHLVGDTHMYLDEPTDPDRVWPTPRENTNYDAVGRDLQSGVLRAIPDFTLQCGDTVDNAKPDSTHRNAAEVRIVKQWLGHYDLEWYKAVGNHDTPYNWVSGHDWGATWGSPSGNTYYTLDHLGGYRVIVLGWDDKQWHSGEFRINVGPLTPDILAWLDYQLGRDSRPTFLAAHAPLPHEVTANPNNNWGTHQSTRSAAGLIDTEATALLSIIDDYPHVVGWLHAHSHDPYNSAGRGANVNLYTNSTHGLGRTIATVDTGAILQKPNDRVPPVTSYVSLADDGKTVEVRWRHHDHKLWLGDVSGGGRVKTVTVP